MSHTNILYIIGKHPRRTWSWGQVMREGNPPSFKKLRVAHLPLSKAAVVVVVVVVIPWGRALEKLTGSHLIKKFPALNGTRRFNYRIQNSPPPLPLLSQVNPVHAHEPMSWRSILILSPIYAWVFKEELGFPSKTCIHLSSLPYVPHALPISFFLVWSPEQYWVTNTDL